MSSRIRLLFASLTVCLTAFTARGQMAPAEQMEVELRVDSGVVENTADGREVIYSTTIKVPDAPWLRLSLDMAILGAAPAGGEPTILRITSLKDGASQSLNAAHLQQWRNTSAYFNGDGLKLEIIADGGAGPSRVKSTRAWAGVTAQEDPIDSICGPTDDRVLSDDPRVARFYPGQCTVWLFDDANHCFLTAGHCDDLFGVVEFNFPLALPDGTPQHPGPEDQYVGDPVSLQSNGGQGIGDDWCYFGCFPNTETGLTAYEAQGDSFTLAEPPPVGNQQIRITGCGTVSSPVPLEWNRAVKTHVGPYVTFTGTTVQYQTDTTGGNSGSPVILEETGEAIGIHTHGGCSYSGGQNSGTGANHAGLQEALANPQGVCIPHPPIDFLYPEGLPEILHPAGDVIRVEVVEGEGGVPQPGTGLLHYDLGGGFITVEMVEVSPNVYDALFPAIDCGTIVSFYFSAETTLGEVATDPVSAPGQTHEAYAIYGFDIAVEETFDTDPGWTTEGLWAFGQPTGGGGQYGNPDPTSGHTGPNVYGYNLSGDYENNLPERHLTSDAIDCSEVLNATLRFWRWLNVEQPYYDHAYVRISTNGVTWTTVWENTTEITDLGWSMHEIDISAIADGESTVYLRWTMGVTDSAWQYSGWNIDDVSIVGFDCTPPCPEDVNGDEIVDVLDLLAVIAAWGNPGGPEDVNGDGIVDVLDLLAVIAAWGPC